MTRSITIEWMPREYQREAWQAVLDGVPRIVLAHHRRAGKDDLTLAATRYRAFSKRADYWYLLPEQKQARKAIWDATNPHTGKRRLEEALPAVLRRRTQDQEMRAELMNGSAFQVLGSDRYDSLVGSPPFGIAFSEYQISDPASWGYLSPILLENGGWAIFNGTSRGLNHFKDLIDYARNEDGWYVSVLSAADTGVFTDEQLKSQEREYQALHGKDYGTALFRQEYLMDFTSAVIGSIFGREMNESDKAGRITNVPVNPDELVHTAWDLGYDDETAIWAFQYDGMSVRVVGYLSGRQEGAKFYVDELRKLYGQSLGTAILPHDGGSGSAQTGGSYKSMLSRLGVSSIVLKNEGAANYIVGSQRGRSLIKRAWFDREATKTGVKALQSFRQAYDMESKTLKPGYVHDWASHPGTAWFHMARGIERVRSAGAQEARFSEVV